MRKPKLQIIVLFQNLGDDMAYYARSPAPPLSGILLAALTPPVVEVEVLHEMVRPIDYSTDADFIALSFMDFCAPHAYRVAARFRQLGKVVVAGGRYPSTFPEAVLPHVDTVVVGEAEGVWPQVVHDLVEGRNEEIYYARTISLEGIPAPRYDLVEASFAVPVVTEATRGCPFNCSFCQLNIDPKPFRTRPIEDVIGDLTATGGLPRAKRKMAMLIDNNLCGDLDYAKALLREVAKLKLWTLGAQFSFNYLKDDEFVELLAEANCGMAFIGLESLNEPSLRSMHKLHNRIDEYEEMFRKLRRRGILTFTGVMLAVEGDTREYYQRLPSRLMRVDPSAILVSLAIPIPGTPLAKEVRANGGLVDDDLSHFDGDHLVSEPRSVDRETILGTFAELNAWFYSWPNIVRRWWRFIADFIANGKAGGKLFRAVLMSYVLLQLSKFQRHRTRTRILPMVAHERRRPNRRSASRSSIQREAEPGTVVGLAVGSRSR
jgi:radical SAM superfamily enzyme YgiQ (UPF0313 family)